MGFSNQCLFCSERLVCNIKRRKSFFHDLFSQSMTWEYRGLEGVTGGYKGLKGVTGDDKGLQGVAKDCRNFFLTRTFPHTFSWSILHKKSNLKKSQIFDQNHGLTPFQKCQFIVFLKPMFFLFRKACLQYKTSKIVFSRSIFTIYDVGIHGVTRGYRGLHGVTGGLQGVTGGYKGLQGVTEGDKRLQGVTRGYMGLKRIVEVFL